ncbi:hypothetical protein [Brevundimonas sp. PWP3-1b1]|uniref:hypothetical protein n=1 Tax=unclassified Brevundimonas TaxID=2622653 RepID=UPI003CEF0E38
MITMSVFRIGNEVVDYEIHLLERHLRLLDTELAAIHTAIALSADPDTDGLFDAGEYFIGSGFVAIQRYITSVRCSEKVAQDVALKIPPVLSNGMPFAQALHVGANYWKHVEEWFEPAFKGSALNGLAAKTLDTLEKSTPWAEYTCSNLLAQLGDPNQLLLTPLIPKIMHWRNAMMKLSP